MEISRSQIIHRGLAGRCPNCGAHTLFRHRMPYKIKRECAGCGLRFTHGDGFFRGPLALNCGVTVFGFILPVLALHLCGAISTARTLVICGTAGLLLPILLHRPSWSWWLMVRYFIHPKKLPENEDRASDDEER